MMICKEMQNIVVNGEKKDTPIQLELSLKSWQREHKKKTNNWRSLFDLYIDLKLGISIRKYDLWGFIYLMFN